MSQHVKLYSSYMLQSHSDSFIITFAEEGCTPFKDPEPKGRWPDVSRSEKETSQMQI